jgi:hypothetical protein
MVRPLEANAETLPQIKPAFAEIVTDLYNEILIANSTGGLQCAI